MDDDFIYIGKIVNTHGIKGELRILSNFEYKDRVFIENRRIYIGEKHEEEIIASYRYHKIFEMITLKGYNNINQVLKYLNKDVFIRKNDLSLEKDEFLISDLINLRILLNNENVGEVLGVKETGNNNKVMETIINGKKVLIPLHKSFIKRIDLKDKFIELELIEGMI